MDKKLKTKRQIQIVYKTEDGRTSIVDGEVSSKNRNSLFIRVFKKVILSIDRKHYDLVDFVPSVLKILRKDIQNTNPIKHELKYVTEGFDDGEY